MHSGMRKINRKRTGFMWKIREHRATTFMRLLRWKRSQPAVRIREKDQFLAAKGLFGKQNYGMTEVSSSRPAELVVAGSWVENPETEKQKTYSEAESVYRTFVYDHYTAVDQTMYDKMQEVFWEEDPSETDGIYSALGRIRKVLESRVTYSENQGAIPEDEDPVLWFLDESKEGNAMLYASTAVEALRAEGHSGTVCGKDIFFRNRLRQGKKARRS